VVWLRILRRDLPSALPAARRTLSDARVRHFWDPAALSGRWFAKILPLTIGGPAWDVYLLYRRGQPWGEAPAFWMHQAAYEWLLASPGGD
jgi:hypothetical protein